MAVNTNDPFAPELGPRNKTNKLSDYMAAYSDGTRMRALMPEVSGADYSVILGYPTLLTDTYSEWTYGDFPWLKVVDSCTDNGEKTKCPHQLAFEKAYPIKQQKIDHMRARTTGGVYGHAFVVVVPPIDGMPGKCVVLDNQSVFTTTDPADYTVLTSVGQVWLGEDEGGHPVAWRKTRNRKLTPYDDNTTHIEWITTLEKAVKGKSGYQVVSTSAPSPICDIADCPNLIAPVKYLGLSDYEPNILNLCEAIDRAASNVQAIISKAAAPFLMTFGFSREQRNLFNHRQANAVAHLDDKSMQGAELIQIHAESISVAMTFENELRSAYYSTTGIPDPEKAVGRIGPMTAAEAELREAGRIAHVNALRSTYEMLDFKIGQNVRYANPDTYEGVDGWKEGVEVIWRSLFPTDETQAVTKATALDSIGASKHTVFTTAELKPEDEFKWIEEERNASMKAAQDAQSAMGMEGPSTQIVEGHPNTPVSPMGKIPTAAVHAVLDKLGVPKGKARAKIV